MTPEERAKKVERSLEGSPYIADDIERIATAIREAEAAVLSSAADTAIAQIDAAVKEEREACAAICEAEAGDITIARISAASSSYEHESMRREAAVLREAARLIRERS